MKIELFRSSLSLRKNTSGIFVTALVCLASWVPAHAQLLDSDGDGIPDIAEMAANPNVDQLCWNHNDGNGTSYAGDIGPVIAPHIASVSNISFGTGFNPPTSNWEWILSGADSSTHNEAFIKNDYAEVSFTTINAGTLDGIGHGIVPVAWGGSAAGDYEVTVEMTSPSSSVLYSDGYIPLPGAGWTGYSRSLGTPLDAATTYTFRFYLYNEQNNVGTNVLAFDDMCMDMTFTQYTPADSDGDGVFDHLDIDSDNDGIPDAVEGSGDTDGDGIPNFMDTDSDGDGIDDAIEGHDANGDGVADVVPSGMDTDGDGLDDAFDIDNGGTAAPTQDADGDSIPDYLDLDADGDGILDSLEGNTDTDGDGVPNYLDLDSDNDGIVDSVEATSGVVDTDGDSVPDHLDLDSDNDGISDLYESGDAAGIASDLNLDGTVSVTENVDADADGLMDVFEDGVLAANVGTTPPDTDANSINDVLDLDSDGDGIPDTIEARPTAGFVINDGDVSNDDTDGDGIIDLFDTNTVFGGTQLMIRSVQLLVSF